jgi:nucleoside-diphosphate-sugar epimerase
MSSERPVVLLTGSNGLIGSALARRFKDEFTVIGLDLGEQKPASPVAAFFGVDLTSDASVEDAVARVRERSGSQLASVIHLAAYYDFSGEPSPLYEQVTIQGTGRLLRALRPFTVEQFLFSSTLLVHAPCEPSQQIDISRTRSVLDWQPSRSLRATLSKMIAALKVDPERWYRGNKLDPPSDLDQIAAQAGSARRDGA